MSVGRDNQESVPLKRIEFIETLFVDSGPRGWNASAGALTCRETGWVKAQRLLSLPGRKGEHEVFTRSPTGRMSPEDWAALVASIKKTGVTHQITIQKDKDGSVWIHEGNHRVRAAFLAHRLVPVEISYFGNSQMEGLLFPEIVRRGVRVVSIGQSRDG